MSVEVPTNAAAPQMCLLDRDRLKKIEVSVNSIEAKIDDFLSYDGPVAAIRGRLDMVENKATKAAVRVEEVAQAVVAQERAMNGLAIKVAVISALLSSVGTGTLVSLALKMLG